MDAPLEWYLFVSSPSAIDRAGGFDAALKQLRESLPPTQVEEIRKFLLAASQADENDLSILKSPDLDEYLILELGDSGRAYYARLLQKFDEFGGSAWAG